MRGLNSVRLPWILILLTGAVAGQERAWTFEELKLGDGSRLAYAVALPQGHDRKAYHPVLLALPPGAQTRSMVEAGLERYWGTQATRRGWVVVSPVAPPSGLFFKGGERLIPALIRKIRIDHKVEGNRLHLIGASNGGLSAFRVATDQPFEFRSLTVLPGYPSTERERRLLGRLKGMTVQLYAGGEDARWLRESKRTHALLGKAGVATRLEVFPGEGHVPGSLDGEVVMEYLESLRQRTPPLPPEEAAVARVLDDFHDAAAKGDGKRYFGHFSPEGVFMGTDATERWTVAQFRKYAGPYFDRPSAWIYVPVRRNVMIAPKGSCAWFDEEVWNAKYGECRGTGVLRKVKGVWKVTHYNLTVPIPNALLQDVVEMIRKAAQPEEEK